MHTIWVGEVFNEAPPLDIGPHAKWTPFVDLKELHCGCWRIFETC